MEVRVVPEESLRMIRRDRDLREEGRIAGIDLQEDVWAEAEKYQVLPLFGGIGLAWGIHAPRASK
jgi:hypothetical protein